MLVPFGVDTVAAVTPPGPVLIGFDGSPSATRAVEAAARLLPGAEAVIVHVWHPYGRRTPGGLPSPLEHMVTEGARKEDAETAGESEAIARRGADLANELGLTATPRSTQSDRNPGPALMELADELGAELIVIGPRGLSTVAAALRDGTSRHLALRSRVPVLVVPEHAE
jgi:nucleotide-binding universal stress UspA family protein